MFALNYGCRSNAGRVGGLLLALSLAGAARGASLVSPLVPGYVYGPNGSGMNQYSPTLGLVGSYTIPNVVTMTGAAVSPDGYLITEGVTQGATFNLYLYEVGAGGAVARSLLFPGYTAFGGADIAVDPTTGTIYAAFSQSVLKVAPDLSSYTTLPITFGRVCGLAVSASGTLYVADSANRSIDVVNAAQTRATVAVQTPFPRSPIGLTFGPGGGLYYTSESENGVPYPTDLDRVDVANGYAQTTIRSDLTQADYLAFAADGSYYVVENGSRDVAAFGPTGALVGQYAASNFVGGAVPYAVPEPASAVLSVAAAAGLVCRRSRRSSAARRPRTIRA